MWYVTILRAKIEYNVLMCCYANMLMKNAAFAQIHQHISTRVNKHIRKKDIK